MIRKIILLCILSISVCGCQNSNTSSQEEDYSDFYAAANENVSAKNKELVQDVAEQEKKDQRDILGYWRLKSSDGATHEMMINEDEVIYVIDKGLLYRGKWEYRGYSGALTFGKHKLTYRDDDNCGPVFELENGERLKKDNSVRTITWNPPQQQQQYSDGYNTQSQGAFHSESDVFKYCSKSGFTNKNGVTIRISSTGINFNGSIMGNSIYDQIPTFGLGYSSKIAVEIESPDVAFLKFRDHNDEGWEAVVNSSNGTIEFGWAGNRDFVFRKLVPNYDVFYKK